ncbi:MAG TPA: bifunctional diaminohydroxyphosphoribosylaminopyrimidine deaminase/5-amino-6-(5-phosphoribosylamino)uracil reductase RibD [Elusimicrobia bacterium]|nr:MAG: riboflavin biosynthesis protein RibD [Elusimicrobia bacterium GWF2_62_30]HBA61497.1 bifunctional diaminohydroxyphosphoribosylaminopyrimidine deaminase/5-amino-6-(5-phosphoribosylamino)uracil reductase RibD [Elusimicrobiota bacterium]
MVNKDKAFMSRAVELARRGLYGAHPNPMVGAVVVKDGRVIGEGAHLRFGCAHAEVNALRSCRAGTKGASVYVTLEPCSTFGKTPPCTQALIKAGIKAVYIGALDPNPANGGKSAALLRKAGLKVRVGLLRKECEALNPAFNKFMRTGLPYVTVKIAQSLDGRIADAAGRSRWISGPEARHEAHKLRAEADAVVAGIGTVLADDPLLNVRGVKTFRQPWVVVLDSTFRVPHGARLFGNARVVVATTHKASVTAMKRFSRRAKILVLPSEKGRVSLPALLRALAGLGVGHVLVEGGGKVAGSFISEGLADRFICFVSPLIIGGTASRNSMVWPDALNAARKELGIKARIASIGHAGADLMLDLRF